jgi:hypothetical protein
MRIKMRRTVLLAVTLLVAGCTPAAFDPYQRTGTWTPASDNDANLRTMIANPQDLAEGIGEHASAGGEAAAPVARLLAGKRYPLPSLNASEIATTPDQQQQGSANPGPPQ